MPKRKWATCARVMIFILPALLLGQSERGTISGLVKDPSGAVVANAKVTVTNTATNNVVVVNTSQTGDYTALSLQAGNVYVRVEASGFKTMVIANISLNASTDVRADATWKWAPPPQPSKCRHQPCNSRPKTPRPASPSPTRW